jgi:hypothetical protein
VSLTGFFETIIPFVYSVSIILYSTVVGNTRLLARVSYCGRDTHVTWRGFHVRGERFME